MSFTIIGLIMDILGAWFIAYEIIFRQPKILKIKLANELISGLKSSLRDLKEIWNLPSPPYTPEEVEKYQSNLEEDYNKKIDEQKTIIEKHTTAHENKAFIYAFTGIIFLTIGFLLQIIGAIPCDGL